MLVSFASLKYNYSVWEDKKLVMYLAYGPLSQVGYIHLPMVFNLINETVVGVTNAAWEVFFVRKKIHFDTSTKTNVQSLSTI